MLENFRPVPSKRVIDAGLSITFVAIGIENTRDDVNFGKGCPKLETLVPVPYRGSGADIVSISALVFLDHLSDNRFAML